MEVKISFASNLEEAPIYGPSIRSLEVKEVIIVNKGTVEGGPVVDFLLVDTDDNEYIFMAIGNLIAAIGGAVTGNLLQDKLEPLKNTKLH